MLQKGLLSHQRKQLHPFPSPNRETKRAIVIFVNLAGFSSLSRSGIIRKQNKCSRGLYDEGTVEKEALKW
jgi:hypothetical protein